MSKHELTLTYSFDDARERCLNALAQLGWQVRRDMSSEDRIACYVPIPELLPQAPIYFVSLYPLEEDETHLVLIAASDDLSQSHAEHDLPILRDTIAAEPSSTGADHPQMTSTAQPSPGEIGSKCFVSYRRHDSADAAGRIYDRLVAQYGHEGVFKDVDNIPLGADFRQVISDAVGSCAVLLAVIGRDWLTASNERGDRRLDDPSDFVRIEIETALQRTIPVIPLLVRDASIPPEDALPDSLRDLVYRNGIRIRSDPDFHHDMDRLIAALDEVME